MRQAMTKLEILTAGRGFTDVTNRARSWAEAQDIKTGLLTAFLPHTSASLIIQENADPDVLADLEDAFSRLAPVARGYRHRTEGPDDMPAHIRAALTQTSLGIPLVNGRLGLGTWQALYLYEHREQPHRRSLLLHLVGA